MGQKGQNRLRMKGTGTKETKLKGHEKSNKRDPKFFNATGLVIHYSNLEKETKGTQNFCNVTSFVIHYPNLFRF